MPFDSIQSCIRFFSVVFSLLFDATQNVAVSQRPQLVVLCTLDHFCYICGLVYQGILEGSVDPCRSCEL
jgi:hypothetical protein